MTFDESGRSRRVAFYLRISTSDATSPFSLSAQQSRLMASCDSAYGGNWRLHGAYEDQKTGATLDRTGLRAMLHDAWLGAFDEVHVLKVDRLARKLKDLMSILDRLETFGVSFKSAIEHFDTSTPSGKALCQMLGAFAEFERESISLRIKTAIRRQVELGKPRGGRVPYGYRLCRDGAWKILKNEAAIVRKIFALYVDEDLGDLSIARRLDMEVGKPRYASSWSRKTIGNIIANTAYLGIHGKSQPIKNHHAAIVTTAIFNRAQTIRSQRERLYATTEKSPFPLTGILVCGQCGRNMTAATYGSGEKRYRCRSASLKPHADRERRGPIKASFIEKCVAHDLSLLLGNPVTVHNIRDALAEICGRWAAPIKDKVARVDRSTLAILKSLQEAYVDFESTNGAEHLLRIRQLDSERNALIDLRRQLLGQLVRVAVPLVAVDQVVKEASAVDWWRGADDPNARGVNLRKWVKEVTVERGRMITVSYRLPIRPVEAGYRLSDRRGPLTSCTSEAYVALKHVLVDRRCAGWPPLKVCLELDGLRNINDACEINCSPSTPSAVGSLLAFWSKKRMNVSWDKWPGIALIAPSGNMQG